MSISNNLEVAEYLNANSRLVALKACGLLNGFISLEPLSPQGM